MRNSVLEQLIRARTASKLSQADLAARAGVNRMTIQRTELEKIDPKLSTVMEMARAMGLEFVLVPKALRAELEGFIQSGGRSLGQPAGAGAPPSVVESLTGDVRQSTVTSKK
jgi:DNA-binding XRE family transcriptional regulator